MRQIATRLAGVLAATVAIASMLIAPAHAADPASGYFSFRTANGILPTWERAGLRLSAVSPANSTTSMTNANVTMRLPVVAVQGNTTFTAGGFRITNTRTGDFVNCANPAITPIQKVVECVLQDGTNLRIFEITEMGTTSTVTGSFTRTRVTRSMVLRLANRFVADQLNKALDVSVFSPSVNVASAGLTVSTPR